jgi:hypothetical protein
MLLIYKDLTSLEIKYKLNNSSINSQREISSNNDSTDKNHDHINKQKFNIFQKISKNFNIFHERILDVLESKSIIEIYWPE